MRSLLAWLSRVAGSFVNRRSERRLDDELAFHLEMQTRKEMERGRSPEEARRAAYAASGRPRYDQGRLPRSARSALARHAGPGSAVRMAHHATRPWLRRRWRSGRSPSASAPPRRFSASSAALFSRRCRIANRNAWCACTSPRQTRRRFRLRRTPWCATGTTARTLRGIAGFTREDLQLAIDDRPERLQGLMVSSNYFDVLGVRPAIGRAFTWSEERANATVAIISDAVWRTRFGADRAIVGRVVRLSGTPFTIVGVMPPDSSTSAELIAAFRKARPWTSGGRCRSIAPPARSYSHYVNAVARLWRRGLRRTRRATISPRSGAASRRRETPTGRRA